MATQAIRYILNQSDTQLYQIKRQLKEEGKKKISSLQDQIVSEDVLKQKFDIDTCSLESQNKVEQTYNQTKETLNNIKSAIESQMGEIDKLYNTSQKIQGSINKVQVLLNTLNTFIPIFNAVLKGTPALLAASSGPTANGAVIKKLSDLIDKAKSKIKEFKNAIKTFIKVLPKYLKKITKILGVISALVLAVKGLLSLINFTIQTLELLYLMYISKCNIDGSLLDTSTLDLDSLNDEYGNLMNELQLAGQDEIIEKIYNANFELIGYKRYKI